MTSNFGYKMSQKTKGRLWFLAATPFLIGPLIFHGNPATIAVGIVFLMLGINEIKKN